MREHAIAQLGDSFRQFSRNGRWGTCSGCPRDTAGNAYPEFCQFTTRHDHQLDALSLAVRFERADKGGFRRGDRSSRFDSAF